MPPKKRKASELDGDMPEPPAMSKSEATKMLNYLKYRSSAQFKGVEQDKIAALSALNVYQSLDNKMKSAFLQQFSKNKKDLSWTKSFRAEHVKEDVQTDTVSRGYRNIAEILKLNGLNYASFPPAEAHQVAMALVKQSAELFGHEPSCIEHDMPLLKQYFYVKDLGTTATSSTSSRVTVAEVVTGAGNAMDSATMKQMPGHGKDDIHVKVESPTWAELQVKLVKLKKTKSGVERIIFELRDAEARVGESGHGDVTRILTAISNLDKFLNMLRKTLVTMSKIPSDQVVHEEMSYVDELITEGGVHLEAARIIVKMSKCTDP